MTPKQDLLVPPARPELARNLSSSYSNKASVPSSHDDADDEQSLSEVSSAMESDSPVAQYDGEDTRLTSSKELSGFYMYGWAAEVFVVCGIGSFIPVTLEQLARENGVLLSDRTTPCKPSLPATTAPPYSPFSPAPKPDGQCIVTILGVEINTASFAMYTFSISVLIQALLIISMSGAADHGRFRKTFLLSFAFVGSIATMLFLPIVPKVYLLGALLAIISNTCFGASFVLLNSFLPVMVRNHPTVRYADRSSSPSFLDDSDGLFRSDNGSNNGSNTSLVCDARDAADLAEEETVIDSVVDATTALLRTQSDADLMIPNPRSMSTPSPELALSTKISSYGIAIGYIAALVVQTLGIIIVILSKNSSFGLRLVLFVIGLWWFIFSIPTALWLRPRPGPPLHIAASKSNLQTCLAYFTYSWKSLGRTVKHARLLKDVLLFLAAWFLLSDSIATVSGTAVLFAKTTLGMSYAMLALINVIATVSGVLGAITWSRISIFIGLKPTQTIMACIFLFELIPLYGLLGYIPAIRRLGSFGLQQQWEMYPLGAVYGFVLGGLSSYCRSLFGELIPPGYEAAFYALYAITDKGSSVFGPAIVGAITDRWGEIRPAFWFLAVLVGLPFPIMMMVDVNRGRAEGIALAKELAILAGEEEEEENGDVFVDDAVDEEYGHGEEYRH